MQQRQRLLVLREAMSKRHDDGKDHGSSAYDRGPDQHRFRRGFKGITRSIVFFQHVFSPLEIHRDFVIFVEFFGDSGNLLNQ